MTNEIDESVQALGPFGEKSGPYHRSSLAVVDQANDETDTKFAKESSEVDMGGVSDPIGQKLQRESPKMDRSNVQSRNGGQ
jgi:hypothetical protein